MNSNSKQHYHIITSCDEKPLDRITVLIYSISLNLKDAYTDFYVLCRKPYEEKFKMLSELCSKLGNIAFHYIIIENPELYDELGKNGGGWCGEAYFSFCAHNADELKDTDRVLYLDAGDVIVTGDISDFYNCDFQGKSLIVHGIRYKEVDNKLVYFDRDDMQGKYFPSVARGIFNSGSYVMNLKKMREDGLSINDYLYLKNVLAETFGRENKKIYFGDQGLLSIAFTGDIYTYNYENLRFAGYMPYNFCMWYYDNLHVKPDYAPAVVHFAGSFKPWEIDYPIYLSRYMEKDGLHKISELKLGQAEWYYLWHEYAMLTDKLLTELGY